MKRKDKFDYILVETTGLADPGPVAQTFFVDHDIKAKTKLDGIVTLVDAKHVWQHFDESNEVKEQIAFADVILLNKIDLVEPANVDELEEKIRRMNVAARIIRTTDAVVDMNAILDIRGFDLDHALGVDPTFLELEHPFEWAGCYDLEAGIHELRLGPGRDATMNLVILRIADASDAAFAETIDLSALLFSEKSPFVRKRREALAPAERLWQLALEEQPSVFPIVIDTPGIYVIFTEHGGVEYDVRVHNAGEREIAPMRAVAYKPTHSHDATVTSVGIDVPGDCVEEKLNDWFRNLLANDGVDIFRMKGVLSIEKSPRRFVFQGVHMLFDGRPDRPWGDNPRRNTLIFIGRNLDRAKLTNGFHACLAS
jgi:G3E family GTPase